MRSSGLGGLALVAALGFGFGCSSPSSYIVLALQSATTSPIIGVTAVSVIVAKGTQSTTLVYPASDLVIPTDANPETSLGTLSVNFSGGETGDVTFSVSALNGVGCTVGAGTAIVTIKKGSSNEGLVLLGPYQSCNSPGGPDGGNLDSGSNGDGGAGLTFAGCNPVGAASCTANQTCQVDCVNQKNSCTASGAGAPGAACQNNIDCAAGSQCFDYTNLGCSSVKICLRFCDTDSQCAAGVDAGVGPGSFCRDAVCDDTAYRTCTSSCDPTAAAATAAATGCPTGLACVMTASADHVDCTCPLGTSTRAENVSCTGTADCRPGLICEGVCRAVCLCNASDGHCTTAGPCPTAGTECTPVTGQTIYGVCL